MREKLPHKTEINLNRVYIHKHDVVVTSFFEFFFSSVLNYNTSSAIQICMILNPVVCSGEVNYSFSERNSHV